MHVAVCSSGTSGSPASGSFSIEDSSQIDQFPKNTGVISSRERASDIAEYLLADKGYDSDTSIEKAKWEEWYLSSPSSESSFRRDYDSSLDKLHRLAEKIFLQLKQHRGITARYDKRRILFCDCANTMHCHLG